MFDGPVVLRRAGADDEPLELVSEWRHNARGLGLQDLCRAVRDGTPQRAGGALGAARARGAARDPRLGARRRGDRDRSRAMT